MTWTKSYLPKRTDSVLQIQFVDTRHGWAATGTKYGVDPRRCRLWRTVDGGKTWKQLWKKKMWLSEFQFVDSRRGYFVADTVYATKNGGIHAEEYASGEGPAEPRHKEEGVELWGVRFIDSKNGWACGRWMSPNNAMHKVVVRTTNGGKTWKRASKGLGFDDVYDVWFVSKSTGYALGRVKGLYRTTNGGRSWRRIRYAKNELYRSLQAFGPNDVILMGTKDVTDETAERVWRSSDGGRRGARRNRLIAWAVLPSTKSTDPDVSTR